MGLLGSSHALAQVEERFLRHGASSPYEESDSASAAASDLDDAFLQDSSSSSSSTPAARGEVGSAGEVDRTCKAASVLIALFLAPDGRVHVWLTQRSIHLSTHSGEVALPGGKCDENDADEIATSLREAEEEIGLIPSHVKVVARMEPFLSKHLLVVTPVVGILASDSPFTPFPNEAEVERVFHVPLETFLQDDGHSHKDVQWLGLPFRIHFFDCIAEGTSYNVWGLTASILIRAAAIAFGREPAFQEWHPDTLPTHNKWVSEFIKRRWTLNSDSEHKNED